MYEQRVKPQDNDNGEPIFTVTAERNKSYPVIVTAGPRTRTLLTAREALALARLLVDAVLTLN